MADSDVVLNLGGGGANIDTESLIGVGSATVQRQRMQVSGAALAEIAAVKNADQGQGGSAYGQVVRLVGRNPVVLYDAAGNPLSVTTGIANQSALMIAGQGPGPSVQPIGTDSSGRVSSILYDANGNQVAVGPGGAVGTHAGLLIAGSDGTNTRLYATDVSGNTRVVGAGAATNQQANPIYSNLTRSGAMATYYGTLAATTISVDGTSLAYLWHPSSVTKTYRITKIRVSWNGGAGTGSEYIQIQRISALNATPGGTAVTPAQANLSDAASGATVTFHATGNPTRPANYIDLTKGLTVPSLGDWTFQPDLADSKGLELRASQNEGIEISISVVGSITTGPAWGFYMEWVEF